MIERNDNMNIIAISSPKRKVDAILEFDSMISHEYDTNIINTDFTGFDELLISQSVNDVIVDDNNLLLLSSSYEALKYEYDLYKKQQCEVFSIFKSQLPYIFSSSLNVSEVGLQLYELINMMNFPICSGTFAPNSFEYSLFIFDVDIPLLYTNDELYLQPDYNKNQYMYLSPGSYILDTETNVKYTLPLTEHFNPEPKHELYINSGSYIHISKVYNNVKNNVNFDSGIAIINDELKVSRTSLYNPIYAPIPLKSGEWWNLQQSIIDGVTASNTWNFTKILPNSANAYLKFNVNVSTYINNNLGLLDGNDITSGSNGTSIISGSTINTLIDLNALQYSSFTSNGYSRIYKDNKYYELGLGEYILISPNSKIQFFHDSELNSEEILPAYVSYNLTPPTKFYNPTFTFSNKILINNGYIGLYNDKFEYEIYKLDYPIELIINDNVKLKSPYDTSYKNDDTWIVTKLSNKSLDSVIEWKVDNE
ncbi:MAG TPA: hypothetical protein PLY35_09005 [Thermotogota bacterium]|nr:hypothetical protein [Thermotogota bacterium]